MAQWVRMCRQEVEQVASTNINDLVVFLPGYSTAPCADIEGAMIGTLQVVPRCYKGVVHGWPIMVVSACCGRPARVVPGTGWHTRVEVTTDWSVGAALAIHRREVFRMLRLWP
jgi:hypothetical protein